MSIQTTKFKWAVKKTLKRMRRRFVQYEFRWQIDSADHSAVVYITRLSDRQEGSIRIKANHNPEKQGIATAILPLGFPPFEQHILSSLLRNQEFREHQSNFVRLESLETHGTRFISGSTKKPGSHGQDKHK